MTEEVPDYVQRMAEEFQQLDERTTALDKFICENPLFRDLVLPEQQDMRQQLVHMMLYREALQRRLLRIGEHYNLTGDKK